MDTISFKRHRFPPEIIRHAVWLYARFALSYRDVEDLLAERGLDISYESVRRWFLEFGAPIARNLSHTRPIPDGYWHLDGYCQVKWSSRVLEAKLVVGRT